MRCRHHKYSLKSFLDVLSVDTCKNKKLSFWLHLLQYIIECNRNFYIEEDCVNVAKKGGKLFAFNFLMRHFCELFNYFYVGKT